MTGDDAALAAGLARWLQVHRDRAGVVVGGLARPQGGYSADTVFADVTWTGDDGPRADRLVVRAAPMGEGTFATYDLLPQWQAQHAVSAVGVPVADPVLEPDAGWIGRPFIVMPCVDGHVVGPLAHLDPWLSGLTASERTAVHDGLLDTVVAVHRADPAAAPDVARRDNSQELDHWQAYLSWSTHGVAVPALVEALTWCRRHLPDREPPASLLWGDVRLENVVLGDDLLPRAVLDWDMTTVGAPEHDLAWLTSLDDTQYRLFGQRADGFPGREGTVARFEELTGRAVRDLEWYETFAMLRSTAVMTRIGVLRRDAGKQPMLPIEDNPILDLLAERLA